MPQERLSVRKIQEVLRLKWEGRLSNRAIARSCSISPTTASEYVRRAQATGLSWPLPETLDEDQLHRRLFPKPAPPSERVIPEPDWEHSHTELRRKGVTRRLLWLEYREAHPDGYGYSRFPGLVRQDRLRGLPAVGQVSQPFHAPDPQGRGEDVRGLRRSDRAAHRSRNRGDP